MSNNILIYTIFKSRQNGPGELDPDGWTPGVKDTVLSWRTREDAANAMFTQAKNLERDGHIRVLERVTPDPEKIFHASITFEQHGIIYQRWIVGEFLI